MEKMEKKAVETSKGLTVTLGIVCVILAVGLIVAVSNYTSTIKDKEKQITLLENEISQLKTQTATLTNKVNELTAIVNLQKSKVLVEEKTVSQPANSYTSWKFSIDYAGYISVVVHSSTTTNTYVRVTYSAYGVNYDNTITVGANGTAVFPVLPCSSVEVKVGNKNLLLGATETVTITYTY